MEVSEYLVGSPAFKAGGTGDPRPAGSIPVHLRQSQPDPMNGPGSRPVDGTVRTRWPISPAAVAQTASRSRAPVSLLG
jgi:hypothetical protein